MSVKSLCLERFVQARERLDKMWHALETAKQGSIKNRMYRCAGGHCRVSADACVCVCSECAIAESGSSANLAWEPHQFPNPGLQAC